MGRDRREKKSRFLRTNEPGVLDNGFPTTGGDGEKFILTVRAAGHIIIIPWMMGLYWYIRFYTAILSTKCLAARKRLTIN